MDRITIDSILQRAMNHFNEEMDTQYSMENIRHEYYDFGNAAEVYGRFCSRYFPDRLKEDYHAPDYFGDSIAMAFTGAECDGILCNEPVCEEFTEAELYEIFLHELSHIFCIHNEIKGGDFYKRYCSNNSNDSYRDGIMNAGYAVWREFIADVMAGCVCEYGTDIRLQDVRPLIAWHWEQAAPKIPNAKRHFSELLFLLVMSREIAPAETWDEVRKCVKKLNVVKSEVFYNLLAEVWENLHRGNCWEIDEEFIYNLGSDYLSLLAAKHRGTGYVICP